jgi:hypothetical protein
MNERSPRTASPPLATLHADGVDVATATEVGLATNVHAVLGIWCAWAVVGVLTAAALRRRGYEFGPAAAVGAVLGPLFVPLARHDLQRSTPGQDVVLVAPPRTRGGPVDVFVAVDGTSPPDAIASTLEQWVGTRAGRVTIAGAIDYESARSGDLSARARRMAREIDIAASTLEHNDTVGRVLVGGPADETLSVLAKNHAYHVVIICSSSASTTAWRQALAPTVPVIRTPPGELEITTTEPS